MTAEKAQPGAPGVVVDAVEAVGRSFRRPSRRYRAVVVVLGVVVLAGLAAWAYQLQAGMAVAGYRDSSFWAIYIANVVTFIGVSYGGAVVSAILMLAGASWRAPLVRLAEGVALVTVLVGAAFIIPHLGRPDRLLGMVTHANVASPVFWDMVAILTYTFATFVFFLLPLVPDAATLLSDRPEELGRVRTAFYRFVSHGWVGSPEQRRVLHSAMITVAVLIIPLAVSVHSVLAWAFSLVSRPGWHESIWAPYFVIAALYSGVALVIVVCAAFRRGYHLESLVTERHIIRLGYIMLALGAVYVYLTFADLLPSAYVGEAEPTQIIYGMLVGRTAVWFWLFLVSGTLLPIVLVALPWTRNVRGIVVAAVLALFAMWLKRLIMVIETSSYNRLTHTFGEGFRFTWVSVTTTLAGVAVVALLLMLLFRLVPLLSLNEIDELAAGPERATRTAKDATGSRTRAVGQAGVVVAIVLACVAGGSATTHPADAATSAGPPPSVSVTTSQDGQQNTATATVTAGGKPVDGALVHFYESTTMFAPGDNQVPLGDMETDSHGSAQVTWVAAVAGPVTITAEYYPSVLEDPVVGTAPLDIAQAVPQFTPPSPPLLDGVGHVLARVLFGLVALVVVLLVAQVVRVRHACRSGQVSTPASTGVRTGD